MKKTVLCGVDVSAKTLAVAIDSGRGEPWEGTFANDTGGHRKLTGRLGRSRNPCRVLVEATGVYHLDLCLALVRAPGVEVMVSLPRFRGHP